MADTDMTPAALTTRIAIPRLPHTTLQASRSYFYRALQHHSYKYCAASKSADGQAAYEVQGMTDGQLETFFAVLADYDPRLARATVAQTRSGC